VSAGLPELGSLPHGWTRGLDLDRLLPATCLFNPALVIQDHDLWMAYRRVSPDEWLAGPRQLGLCRIGPDLQADPESNVDLSAAIDDPPGADTWHADPRLFRRDAEVWLSYHDNYRLCLAELPLDRIDRVKPRLVRLSDRPARPRERNWGFFQTPLGLRAVYSICPHVVLGIQERTEMFEAVTLAESASSLPWDRNRWGEPHGGSMPVRVGRHWFSFFQAASYDEATNHRHYRVGFYGFEDASPHRICLMSSEPVLDAGLFPGPTSFYNAWSVVYPSGAVYLDGKWLLSLGIHDRRIAFAVLDHAVLLEGCAEL
jgi:predicted GH43/DUF377 family glycosyl hydrolase